MSRSYQVPGFKPGVLESSADLSTKQFHAVKMHSVGGQVAQAGAGELAIGILQDKPDAALQGVEIEMDGISKAVAGAAVAVGAKLMSNAAGRLITATSGNHVVAIALEAAPSDGAFIAVKVVGSAGQLLA